MNFKIKTPISFVILIALIFFISIPQQGLAHVWENHLKPTLTDGFDKEGFLILAGGLVLTGLAQQHDYATRASFNDYQRMNEKTARFGDFLGTGIAGATFALGQLIWDNENGMAHAEALIDTFVVTSVLKYSNKRNRPDSENKHSMPSGHSSTTFASATSLTYAYGWKAALPAYSLATLTAVSRWTDDAHWLSDTVFGAVLGIFWGRATYLHHSPESSPPTTPASITNLLPIVTHNFYGLTWNTHF